MGKRHNKTSCTFIGKEKKHCQKKIEEERKVERFTVSLSVKVRDDVVSNGGSDNGFPSLPSVGNKEKIAEMILGR